MILTAAQISSDSVAFTAGTATLGATVVAAPGANLRLRVFAVHVVSEGANSGKVRYALRDITTAIIFWLGGSNGGGFPDHGYFGEGGYVLPASHGVEIRHLASVAAQACLVNILYLVEPSN